MSVYPRLIVHLDRVARNAQAVLRMCARRGVGVTAITKGVCGDPVIAALLVRCGAQSLGDSRLGNLERYTALPCEKWLIRMPMISECQEVVELADVSLVTERATLGHLSREARRRGRRHGVVVMFELGDRREGCDPGDELTDLVRQVERSPGLYLKGVGTNLGCFGFVRTTGEKMRAFARVVRPLVAGRLLVFSGGNSSALRWLEETDDPAPVNHLRLGEALLFGRERRDFTQMAGTVDDAFMLEAEIIELRRKPSLPDGEIGRDSFGRVPTFADLGRHWRAICAVGRQDVEPEMLEAQDPAVSIVGASFDHLVVAVPEERYRVGGVLSFRVRYPAVLRAMSSAHVTKKLVTAHGTAGASETADGPRPPSGSTVRRCAGILST